MLGVKVEPLGGLWCPRTYRSSLLLALGNPGRLVGMSPPKPQFPSQLSWLKRAWVPKGYKIRWAEGGSAHTSCESWQRA